MAEKFELTRSARFYPGAWVKPERAQALFSFQVDIDDITVDDRMFVTSQTSTGWLHGLLELVVERWGKEAAKEVAYEFGRRIGGHALKRFMETHKVDQLTPELFCKFQNTGWAMGHSAMAHCVASYDDSICELRRTQCALYSPTATEATRDLCTFIDRGAGDVYQEMSPNMKKTLAETIPNGDSFCHHIFEFTSETS